MNKILSLLCVSFLVLFLVSASFAIADNTECEVDSDCEEDEVCVEGECEKIEEEPECEVNSDCEEDEVCVEGECEELEEEDGDEIAANVKLPFVKVASIWNGFIVNENETEAEQIRVVLTRQRYGRFFSVIDEQIIEEIKSIKETETPKEAKVKIKELIQQRVQNITQENGGVGGLLIIGKGKNHETYRLVAKEVTEETAEFDIYKLGAIKLTTKPKLGLFIGIRRAFGLAKKEETTEVVEEINETEIEPIGSLSVERNSYEHIEIEYGTLELEETEYQGSWDVTAYSFHKIGLYKKA